MDRVDVATKRSALLVATIGSFLFPLVGSSVNIALPVIGVEFSMDAVLLSWIATSFLLAAAMFLVPFGRLGDIYGRKKIFTIGIIFYTIASLFSAISVTSTQLLVSRVLHGISSAMIFGTGVAILTSVFPPEERGRALGINVAAVYLGLSIGPFLGGFLVQHLGWRSIFYANIPPGLFILILVFWKLKGEWAEAKGETFDWKGSLILSATLLFLMYGLSLLPDFRGAWLVLLSLLGFLLFVFQESRVAHPVININLFRMNRVFAFSNLAALISYAATFAVAFLLSLYLQYIKAMSPQSAGTILVAQPIMMTIFSPIAGRLSDKIEPRIVASLGMGLTVVGLALLIPLGAATKGIYIIVSLMVLGVGFGLFSSPNTNAVMSSVERKYYGVASGALGTMRLTGQMLSMGIVLLIFAVFIGRVEITPEHFPAFIKCVKIAFSIFSVLCLLGVFASLARGKLR